MPHLTASRGGALYGLNRYCSRAVEISELEPTQEAFHPQMHLLDFVQGSASTGFSTELH